MAEEAERSSLRGYVGTEPVVDTNQSPFLTLTAAGILVRIPLGCAIGAAGADSGLKTIYSSLALAKFPIGIWQREPERIDGPVKLVSDLSNTLASATNLDRRHGGARAAPDLASAANRNRRPTHRLSWMLRRLLIVSAIILVSFSSTGPSGAASYNSINADGSTRVPVVPVSLNDPGVIVTPNQDLPDPFVVRTGHRFYLFSSGDELFGPNVPVLASNSLMTWGSQPSDAMPKLPTWADPGSTWSPDIRRVKGRWVMWFNAGVAGLEALTTKCIGVATSSSVAGPYVSSGKRPRICQLNHLGSIDPRTFLDPSGHLWLLWKSDDNADPTHGSHTTIWVQQLSSDGLQLLGRPVALLSGDLPWENGIVEAPDMVFAGGHFWLFFSGNWFNQPAYGIGVAQCAGPVGPCQPSTSGPWLGSDAEGAGPGEASLFFDGSRWWMLYAPFSVDFDAPYLPRPLALARLAFGAQGPVVVSPGTAAWSATAPPIRFLPAAPIATESAWYGVVR
jgi:hypothetical protein